MKKLYLLILWILLTGAQVPTTGIVYTNNCSGIVNPIAFQTWCANTTNGQISIFNGSGYTQITGNASPGSGTVTNAAPLTLDLPVIGAGANAVAVGSRTGNTNTFATSTGNQTSGRVVSIDANGNHIASNIAEANVGNVNTSGTPTVNQVPKFTSSTAIGNSQIKDDGTDITMGDCGTDCLVLDKSSVTGTKTISFPNASGTIALAGGGSGCATTGTELLKGDGLGGCTNAAAAANSKLLGSGASGSGSPYAELTLGTNLSMSGTTLNAAGGSGGLTLVETQTLTGAATSVTFSSLDGNTDGVYRLIVRIKGAVDSTDITIKPNNVTTNQSLQRLYVGGNDTKTSWLVLTINNGSYGFIEADIVAKNNPNSQAFARTINTLAGGSSNTPSANQIATSYGLWTDTSTNLTSLVIEASQTNGFANGSQFSLYKYAQ